jgi:ribonuclease HI
MTQSKEDIIEVFTDGACSGNPGPGGWASIIRIKGKTHELTGGESQTTNNRMELMAAIKALEFFDTSTHLHLYTDSLYLKDGITQWIIKWKENGWKTSNKKPVKNAELWQELDTLCQKHQIEWHWVKAHNGHQENERADFLARNAIVTQVMQTTLKDQANS